MGRKRPLYSNKRIIAGKVFGKQMIIFLTGAGVSAICGNMPLAAAESNTKETCPGAHLLFDLA